MDLFNLHVCLFLMTSILYFMHTILCGTDTMLFPQISRLIESDKMSNSEFRERGRGSGASANGDSSPKMHSKQLQERMEEHREKGTIVLWRRPVLTLYYFFLELLSLTWEYSVRYLVLLKFLFINMI